MRTHIVVLAFHLTFTLMYKMYDFLVPIFYRKTLHDYTQIFPIFPIYKCFVLAKQGDLRGKFILILFSTPNVAPPLAW